MRVVLTPVGCCWVSEGEAFVLDGDPNLTLHASREMLEHMHAGELNGTLRGRVT